MPRRVLMMAAALAVTAAGCGGAGGPPAPDGIPASAAVTAVLAPDPSTPAATVFTDPGSSSTAVAAGPPEDLGLEVVAEGLDTPVFVTSPPGDHRLFVVEIEGHTDFRSSADYNLELSRRRAQAVVGWLVSQGIDDERLEARGYGESRPIADNQTVEGRSRNRRVEVVLTRR